MQTLGRLPMMLLAAAVVFAPAQSMTIEVLAGDGPSEGPLTARVLAPTFDEGVRAKVRPEMAPARGDAGALSPGNVEAVIASLLLTATLIMFFVVSVLSQTRSTARWIPFPPRAPPFAALS